MNHLERELVWLLEKIKRDEDLIQRAEAFYAQRGKNFSRGVASYFEDMMMRKKEQLDFEKYRAERLGWQIAAGRGEPQLEI